MIFSFMVLVQDSVLITSYDFKLKSFCLNFGNRPTAT